MAVSKPLPGQRIDRTAPLAQSVASFWTLNEGAGTAFLDSAGNSPGAASGVVVRSQGGIVLSGSSYVALGKEYAEANKKFSFVTRIKTTTGNQCAIAATWASGSKAGFYVLLNNVAGKLSVGMASASNAAYIQKDATKSVLDGVEHVIGFDYDASQTLAGLTIYIDGQLAAITNTYIAGTIGAFSHTGFNLGADGAGNLKYVGNIGYAGLFVGGNLGAAGHAAIAQNPWQLWPDEPQLVFAPVTTFTGTATTSQAQTAAATGLAGNIGTATSSQAQTAAATGLAGVIGTATASQAQTANATGLAGVIGTATSAQAQSATGAGAETYNGNATSSQAQTAAAVGLAGVIGTATASQAQTSDAIGVAGIVGTATSSQAQTINGTGNNGQLSVQFGGHIAQPQYIHVPMFARGTGKATCKSRPHVRVLTRALAIGRSKGTCRPLARQFMAGRAVGASVPVISSMRLQYNETWHAQRARDDQSLLFGF